MSFTNWLIGQRVSADAKACREAMQEPFVPQVQAPQDYCAVNCRYFCQNSVHGMCDGPPVAQQPDALELLRRLDACCDLDQLVCYASTPAEYEPNAVVRDIRGLLSGTVKK